MTDRIRNMWGTDPAIVDDDEFCIWCEHSTYPDADGTLHYDNCMRNSSQAKQWYATRYVHTGFEAGAL